MPRESAIAVEPGGSPGRPFGAAPFPQCVETSALFAGILPGDRRQIFSLAAHQAFAASKMVYLEGHPVKHLMLLEAGKVKLVRNSRDGSEVILRICGPGEILEMHAVRGSSCHLCSARAMSSCRVLAWASRQAVALAALHPQIRTNMMAILTERLGELEERFCEVATEGCCQLLAQTLLRLVASIGTKDRHGILVEMSRTELAQMTGLTIFTVSRTLSKWSESGIVSRGIRNAIIIQRIEDLKALLWNRQAAGR